MNAPTTPSLLVVISGPSGVGKDTVVHHLKQRGLPFHFVVTATSRPKRPDEVHGVDYFFYSEPEFLDLLERGELLEHALVYNEHKGVPKQQVRDAMASGLDVVMRVDVQGAKTIKQLAPEAIAIFLMARDEAELAQRLRMRKTESEEHLQTRLQAAREELHYLDLFDYRVVNADSEVEAAVSTILAIIEAEHHRTHPRQVTL
ncbi:MAG TPA: guanylate kinase [Anaerolineales bacterium]|jgi:guanylate kinase|nr:guanylate kinase [Anaerolineales bacterium]